MGGVFKKAGVVVLVGSVFLECEEPVRIDTYDSFETSVVIKGLIHQGTGPYEIVLEQTRHGRVVPSAIEDATVTLVDETNEQREILTHVQNGRYYTRGEITGEPGNSYHIEVVTADDITYQSMSETMPERVATNNLSFHFIEFTEELPTGSTIEHDAIAFDLSSLIPGGEGYYSWFAENTYQFIPTDFPDPFGFVPDPCYITRPVGSQTVQLLHTDNPSDHQIVIENLFEKVLDKSFRQKQVFSLYHYSSSSGFHRYLRELKSLTENVGSLFDTPPGLVRGNFYTESEDHQVLGYFAALLTDTVRVDIYPNDVEGDISSDDCDYGTSLVIENHCVNCLEIRGATYERPEFY